MRLNAAVVFAAGLLFTSAANADETFVSLNTRPGITQGMLLLSAEKPRASVILFAGGEGNLKLDGTTIGALKNNFLVRTRQRFVRHGFQVAVVDAPSDRKYYDGMLGGFRWSAEHTTDMQAVIAELKRRADVPVWLIGTSRGTESATHVAVQSQEMIAGVVLTSAITETNRHGRNVTDMGLEHLRVPVLIIAHRNDGCIHTPAAGAERIKNKLQQAPKVEVAYFEGGDPPRSNACDALSQHGFLGLERQVVDTIATFINSAMR